MKDMEEQSGAKPRNIIVAGATGAIGRNVVRLAASLTGFNIVALTRRAGAVTEPGVRELPFDFDNPAAYDELFARVPCDILILALGGTVRESGKTGLLHVEQDLPVQFIEALKKEHPEARIGFVSSIGADKPVGSYLTAKAYVEKTLAESGMSYVAARPSFLRCKRKKFRFIESFIGHVLAPPMILFLRIFAPKTRSMWKYAPVRVEDVADSLLCAVLELEDKKGVVLEGLDLQDPGKKMG